MARAITMRNAIDQMIDLGKVFSSEIMLTKDCDEKYMVSIDRVMWKENRLSCVVGSVVGRGQSVEEACADFMRTAKGKLLIGNDEGFYGKNRPEYICV